MGVCHPAGTPAGRRFLDPPRLIATGTAAGSFLLTPPGWQADVSGVTEVIEFPTTVGTIVGRWACDGEADLGAVRALQDKLTLEPYGPRRRRGCEAGVIWIQA